MPLPITPNMAQTSTPPVMEARRWLAQTPLPDGLELINLSQAAPIAPPPAPLRRAMAEALEAAATHIYGPVLGMPELREALGATMERIYGGSITPSRIAITAGCNQAFCAAISAIAGPGDAVILPVPWYFNHQMWLTQAGIEVTPLPCGPGLLPDPDMAARLITARTRAITLVTPNNPTGIEYPPALIAAFRDLARARGIALIVDETYRDFHSGTGAPHELFLDPHWDDTVIHLYSFSKAYRLTGHRVGALVGAPHLLAEVEKFLDCTTICAPGLGQRAALWGLEHLGQWLAGERTEILARRLALQAGIATLSGWRLSAAGAYFGYLEHPLDLPSDQLARVMLQQAGLLVLPGTMFAPPSDPSARRHLRLAFANADARGIEDVIARLEGLRI